MKKKILVMICVLSITMLIACGGSDNTESSKEDEKSTQLQENETPTTEETVEEEIEEVDVVIEYVQANYPEITIGDNQIFGNVEMEGTEYSINDNIKYKVSSDWVLIDGSSWSPMKTFAYKGEMQREKLVYYIVNGFPMYEQITQDEFCEDVKNRITTQCENDGVEVTMVTKVNISGYNGYCITSETLDEGLMDYICIYVLIDGTMYDVIIQCNNESLDPSIREAGIASALENLNTFVITESTIEPTEEPEPTTTP